MEYVRKSSNFFFFTYFTINCNLHLNITIVFDGNVCKYFLLKSPWKIDHLTPSIWQCCINGANWKIEKQASNTKTLTFLSYICSIKRKQTKSRIFKTLFSNVPHKELKQIFLSIFGQSKGMLVWNRLDILVDTGRTLKVHKTFRRHPGRLLNVLRTFNLRPVSTRMMVKREIILTKHLTCRLNFSLIMLVFFFTGLFINRRGK